MNAIARKARRNVRRRVFATGFSLTSVRRSRVTSSIVPCNHTPAKDSHAPAEIFLIIGSLAAEGEAYQSPLVHLGNEFGPETGASSWVELSVSHVSSLE